MMATATAVSGAVIWVGSESANAADCKSVPYRVVGSTPTLPTSFIWGRGAIGSAIPLQGKG